ncbi:MAG: hypothetical protein JW838_08565 [Spirochaetes bacterium]|nr:hypothetical protein [Spirochaetota bacterium]
MRRIFTFLLISLLSVAGAQPKSPAFCYGDICLGIDALALQKIIAHRPHVRSGGTIVVGDYRDAALMIDFGPDNNVNSITAKKDITDPKSEFNALVAEFTAVYGTPVALNMNGMIAEYSKDGSIALVMVKMSSSNTHLLFIVFCEGRESAHYKSVMAD